MKNPYYINFIWTGAIIAGLGGILLLSCCCGHYYFQFRPRIENILLGILSSAVLLLFVEIINWIVDRKKYGFLNGKYRKTIITQVNSNHQRSSDIADTQTKETNEKIKFLPDSYYHRLDYYECDKVFYYTKLNYQYHGIYTGYVEYYDGNWKEGNMKKNQARITININPANIMTGSGSYKYVNLDDFGSYELHVDDENINRIIVNYKNTLPSGLAEGYEIWERTDN